MGLIVVNGYWATKMLKVLLEKREDYEKQSEELE